MIKQTTLSGIIHAIESELDAAYLPGAIAWADRERDGAWSAAMDRFSHVLATSESVTYVLMEGEAYKVRVLALLKEYKASGRCGSHDEVGEFLAGLRCILKS